MGVVRTIVVDDSALFRVMLRNVLTEIPGCEVVASISDGLAAIEKIIELKPDLVTLDVEMPGMTGIEVLREIKRLGVQTRVVMVSRLTAAGAQVTTDALIEGAFDFILKPSGKDPAENKAALKASLAEKILAAGDADDGGAEASTLVKSSTASKSWFNLRAIVIGCSTGGPDALAQVIPNLPADLPVPVFVVQHMPEGFTGTLAARLNEASEVEVLEASDGLRVGPGQVVLAKGGSHLRLSRLIGGNIVVNLTDDPHENRCRPAVDYTLRSAIELLEGQLAAVILTGMGRDGTAGCQLAGAKGAYIVAQDANGCTVYGMPKAVVAAGVADEVIPLPLMAAAIERLTRRQAKPVS
jgi:two-component system, chemotaxis family, protein-glutamate methylesterase/glutaminase